MTYSIIEGYSINYRLSLLSLLSLAAKLLFSGSLYNELLLDIADSDGDKKNNISTIPVLIGKSNSLKLIGSITTMNVISIVIDLTKIKDLKKGIILLLFYLPLFKNLLFIDEKVYSKESILYAVNKTIKPILASLMYICFLSIQ